MSDATLPALPAAALPTPGLGGVTPSVDGNAPGSGVQTPPARRKRGADGPPVISPCQPVPSVQKVEVNADHLMAPMRQLPAQSPTGELIQATANTVNQTVAALVSVAGLVNEHSDALKLHHDGIRFRVEKERQLDTETSRLGELTARHETEVTSLSGREAELREAIKRLAEDQNRREAELKRVIEANDSQLKDALRKLAAQDDQLAAAARSLGDNQAFMQTVVEKAVSAVSSQLAHNSSEYVRRVDGLEQQVQPMSATLADQMQMRRIGQLEHAMMTRLTPASAPPAAAETAPLGAGRAEGSPGETGSQDFCPRCPSVRTGLGGGPVGEHGPPPVQPSGPTLGPSEPLASVRLPSDPAQSRAPTFPSSHIPGGPIL